MPIIKVNPEGKNFLDAYGVTEDEANNIADKMTEFAYYRNKPVEFDPYEKELVACLICHMDPGIIANFIEVYVGIPTETFEGKLVPALAEVLLAQGEAFIDAHYQTFCFMSASYAVGVKDAQTQMFSQQMHGLMDALRPTAATSAKVEDEG